MKTLRILGLDPGLRSTGWGIVDTQGNRLVYIAHGIIQARKSGELAPRLSELYQELLKIIHLHQPHEAAVEETFVNKNPVSTLKLGMARGVVLLAPAQAGLIVGEYAATRIKKSIVGVGHADKNQVALMVQRLLVSCGSVAADGADALAVAICHAHYRTVIPTHSQPS